MKKSKDNAPAEGNTSAAKSTSSSSTTNVVQKTSSPPQLSMEMFTELMKTHTDTILQQLGSRCSKVERDLADLETDTKSQKEMVNRRMENINEKVNATKDELTQLVDEKYLEHERTISLITDELNDLKMASSSFNNVRSNMEVETFPILKNFDRKSPHASFAYNMKNLILVSDSLLEIEVFYNAIGSAFSAALATGYVFPQYIELTMDTKNLAGFVLPPKLNPRYQQACSIYEMMANTLRNHLVAANTIDKTVAPESYNILMANRMCRNGFDLLVAIIYGRSPQLGGKHDDAQSIVVAFNAKSGELLSEFHQRALETASILALMQDKTGQAYKLIGKYLLILSKQPDIKPHVLQYLRDYNLFMRCPNNHTKQLKFDLPEIYTALDLGGVKVEDTIDVTNDESSQNALIASADLPSPIINYAHRSQRGNHRHQYRPNHHRQQHNHQQAPREYQNTRKPHHFKLGCRACQLDGEGIENVIDHTEHTCPLRGPKFNQDKRSREAVLQFNATHGSDNPRLDKNADKQRNGPIRPTIPRPKANVAEIEQCQDEDDAASSQDEVFHDATEAELPSPTCCGFDSDIIINSTTDHDESEPYSEFVLTPQQLEEMQQ